ncbi:MAG: acetate--CoA ligase family protein [Streptosporangiaceae bacterium]
MTLDHLLAPRSIAVVGASETGPTAELIANLRVLDFAGPIQPINPKRETVAGLACVPSIADCVTVPDLAVLAVSTGRLLAAVHDSADAGVPAVMIYTSGLAETGPEGAARQDVIARVAADAGVRVLGPNCLGFVNVRAGIAAAVFPTASLPPDLRPGPVGLISQSGGLMISCLELGTRLGVRFDLLASTGNECDVTSLDLLDYIVDDDHVTAIGFVLERLADGRRFIEIAERALRVDKPVAVLRLGRSEKGRDAAATHTASVVGPYSEFAAVCAELGVSICHTPADLVERLALFGRRRPTSVGRLAVVTMSGGTRVLVTDLADDVGLEFADIASATRQRLHAALPGFAAVDNPLDLTPAGVRDRAVVRACVTALAEDRGVGTVVLTVHLKNRGGSAVQQGLIEEFCAVGGTSAKQFAVVSSIPEGISGHWRDRAAGPIPFLNDLTALRTLADLRAFEAARAERQAAPHEPPAAAIPRLRPGDAACSEADAYRLLAGVGVPIASWRTASSRDAAAAAAEELGLPVAVKACSPHLAHKSDAGAVAVGLTDTAAVADAFDHVTRAATAVVTAGHVDTALVQQMAPPGVEILIGTSISVEFGPIVSVGLGGVWTELFADVALAVCPVSIDRARSMLHSLRAAPLLDGVRGGGPVDVDAVAHVVSTVSRAAAEWQDAITAIEINPLIAQAGGVLAVDALVMMRPTAGPDGGGAGVR